MSSSPAAPPDWSDRFVVESNYDGWRLDRFLTQKLKRATRSRVAKFIKSGVRFDDGRKVKAGSIVRTGDIVWMDRTERADPETPSLDAVTVLHDDGELVVLRKPPGILVHRTAREASRTIDTFFADRFPGERVEATHRLDRDTSGVLVCGRGDEAISTLNAMFRGSELTKTYECWAHGARERFPIAERVTLTSSLGLDPDAAISLRVGRGDWVCTTHVEALKHVGEVSRLRVQIEQGRQHQIRAHLSLEGTPIVGDKLYGMGDAYFAAWSDDPGDPELVAQLATRWHCLHAVHLTMPWR
ncbi:MAG: RluA family pseudouridine synthase, partial [Flavobacteriales bacterium]